MMVHSLGLVLAASVSYLAEGLHHGRLADVAAHHQQVSAVASAISGSRGLPVTTRMDNRRNMQYYSKITLGGQQVDAIFDTGSFDVVVVSQRCKDCVNPQYDSSASKTYRGLNKTIMHRYGSGMTESYQGVDELSVGGGLVVKEQVIHEIVRHQMKVLDKAAFDAIVGIGPVKGDCNTSVVCNLGISDISVCLERGSEAPGWITWGGSLSAAQKAQALELKTIGKYHWTVSMSDIIPVGTTLSKKQVQAAEIILCGRNCAAILDSGTSLIAAPSHAVFGLRALLPALAADCSNYQDLPDLEFNMNGHKLRLPPQAYALKLKGAMQDKRKVASFLAIKPAILARDVCFYGFIEMDRSSDFGPLWIFGMPFFREYHVTFGYHQDDDKRRVWLSKAGEKCNAEPLPAQSTNWTLKDAAHKHFPVYPKVAVPQKGLSVRKASFNEGPLEVHAADLLAAGGMVPRIPDGAL